MKRTTEFWVYSFGIIFVYTFFIVLIYVSVFNFLTLKVNDEAVLIRFFASIFLFFFCFFLFFLLSETHLPILFQEYP